LWFTGVVTGRQTAMTRAVEVVSEYPADVATTVELLCSERFVARRAEVLGVDEVLVSREELSGDRVRLTVSRALPEGIPPLFQRFLPADGRLTEVDEFGPAGPDGVRTGSWTVSGKGVPVEMGGTRILQPTAAGCCETVSGTVKVRVPIVGGKAEAQLVELVTQLLRKEAQVARDLLG
jgi:Protein of unknown function (DUF2505)